VLGVHRHYQDARGDFYAAAITYFTVFAIWPLLMVGFAVVGFVLASRPALLAEIDSRVKASVSGDLGPQLIGLMDAAIDSRTSVGLIGLAVALWAGLGWMSNLREALSDMWGQPDFGGNFVRTKLSDLAALVATFVASLVTIGLTALATSGSLPIPGGVRAISVLGSLLVSWALFTWMMARLPRQSVPLNLCTRAGLLAAVGFEIFKQVVSIYLRVVLHGPAGATFGPVLGVMVFAYMTARLVLFATAWAATSAPADTGTTGPGSPSP
jgi:membrane protein